VFIPLLDLFSECFATDFEECLERNLTATPVKAFAVGLRDQVFT